MNPKLGTNYWTQCVIDWVAVDPQRAVWLAHAARLRAEHGFHSEDAVRALERNLRKYALDGGGDLHRRLLKLACEKVRWYTVACALMLALPEGGDVAATLRDPTPSFHRLPDRLQLAPQLILRFLQKADSEQLHRVSLQQCGCENRAWQGVSD